MNLEISDYKELLNIVNLQRLVRIVKASLNLEKILAESKKYRDRIYIVKDIILTLSEYGELNQTSLFSFCGLNISKHKQILDNLEQNDIIQRTETIDGKRTITIFKVTQKGMEFCHEILEPYEQLFPRSGKSSKSSVNLGSLFFF